ncbi:MAG TPA: hypothetical protein VN924_20805 [Bryobacteraceae bacterium]|jgi:hypothetical protein|nr:hypothetical protein [Bryobacteraceae bacterium]
MLLVMAASAAIPADVGTTQSNVPLTSDEVAVYRAFLESYAKGSPGSVNLGNRTTPLELSESDTKNCLRGIRLKGQSGRARTVHTLDSSIIAGTKTVLVDAEHQRAVVEANDPGNTIRKGKTVTDAVGAAFALGLLIVSEITFDANHRCAVMAFGFVCGALCGHGAVLVFQEGWR